MYLGKRLKTIIKEFLWKLNVNISFKNKKLEIKREKYNFSPHEIYENLIPPPELNYNYNSSYFNYKKKFLDTAFKTYFPKILEYQKKFYHIKEKNFFLDLGCGYGPMAVAYLNYIKSNSDKNIKYKYLGIDINKNAIEWLKKKYNNNIFNFLLHETDLDKDYLQSKDNNIQTLQDSDATEVEYKISSADKFDIQWSWSLFTHLTPKSCDKILSIISKHTEKNSLQFNSWLIYDEESKFALNCGLTNRLLPYDMGEYLTRSKENPLTATCYKEQFILDIYKKNNLKIVEIIKGNWRGTNNCDKSLNQDLIISQKI
jgi:SAM-dependent methyltransferase